MRTDRKNIPVLLEIEVSWNGVELNGYLTVDNGQRSHIWDTELRSIKRDYSRSPYKMTIKKIKPKFGLVC